MSYNLLTVKEEISNNLSSKQEDTILNILLHAAAAPLFEKSALMRQLVLQTLVQTQDDHRRKVSVHNKDITASLVVHSVLNKDFSGIMLCGIDRSMIFAAVNRVCDKLQRAAQLEALAACRIKNQNKYMAELHLISKEIGVPIKDMFALYNWVNSYAKLYKLFKEYITAKYHKFIWQQACAAQSLTGINVDIKELAKNYEMAAAKAIDKFDADKGTLTSYIMQWMKSAKTNPEFPHQYGEAYSMPAGIRKDRERAGISLTNMSQPIEEKHHEIDDPESLANLQALTYKDNVLLNCLRRLKHTNIIYKMLDLPVSLQSEELNKLQGVL